MPRLVLFDTTIPSSETLKAALGGTLVERVMHNIHARHEAQDLALRDNHLLNDIGLLRSEVEHASHVTMTHDAMEELHDAQIRHSEEVEQMLGRQNKDGLASTNLRSRK